MFFNFDGSISGTINGCSSATGTATPDGSHNFFTISLNLCGATVTGAAAAYLTSNGVPQLLVIGTIPPNGTQKYPTAFVFIGN